MNILTFLLVKKQYLWLKKKTSLLCSKTVHTFVLIKCVFFNTCIFLEAESKVQTRIIAADFSKGTSIYENIRSKLDGLIVGILGKIPFLYLRYSVIQIKWNF